MPIIIFTDNELREKKEAQAMRKANYANGQFLTEDDKQTLKNKREREEKQREDRSGTFGRGSAPGIR